MKLRVAQPEQGELVRRFGGVSITMSAPEVPSALDRGVVDGIFTAGVERCCGKICSSSDL
jgi:TRAP-type C4-dicarboxylate transport system substrate-binding protein